MRFPSLHQIYRQTTTVIQHYTLELIAVAIGTWSAVQLTFHHKEEWEQWLLRILLTAALALPSLLAVTLRGRFRKYTIGRRSIEYGIVTALLLLFLFTLKHPPAEKDMLRFAGLGIAAHLLVACAGFLGRGSTGAFWQFNRHLFLRIITAAIFSGVLFAGLAGALAAINALFGLHTDGEWYARLWIWIAGLFNTVFFLAGVPEDVEMLEGERDYPKVLKVFTQFVLVPLVSIYLVILLAYEIKIVVQWSLPKGWVSHLVIAYGIAGILSVLLVYPIRSMEGNTWIKTFARWFYILLLPLVALMFIAIGTRIANYGLTEERVFVLALAVWLAGISIYYLWRPAGDIRAIPASLAVLAIVLCVGPWSAFELSRRDQRSRLAYFLSAHGMINNNRAVPPSKALSFAERKQLSSTVEYLLGHDGPEEVKPWFSTDSLKKDRWSNYENTGIVLRQVGQRYINPYETDENSKQNRWANYTAPHNKAVSISGYDLYLSLDDYNYDASDTAGVHLRHVEDLFALYRNGERLTPYISPQTTLRSLVKKYGYADDQSNIDISDLQVTAQGNGCKLMVVYDRLNGYADSGKYINVNYSGLVLVKWE